MKDNKLLMVIILILVVVAVSFFALRQNSEPAPLSIDDPFEGLTTEVEVELSEENRATHEAKVLELDEQIKSTEAAGEYVLHLHFEKGFHLYRLGKLKDAFETYSIVVTGDPSNETAWNNLGDIRMNMGDTEGAEQYYKAAIVASPSAVQYTKLYNYYDRYRDDRQDEIGLLLNEAINKLGPSVPMYANLAEWHMDREEYDKAIKAFQQALLIKPDSAGLKEDIERARGMKE